jgi:hypothetical protein
MVLSFLGYGSSASHSSSDMGHDKSTGRAGPKKRKKILDEMAQSE